MCLGNVIWDIDEGTILKLAGDGKITHEGGREITHCYFGFRKLKTEEVYEKYYGDPPQYDLLKWPQTDGLKTLEDGSHWTMMGVWDVGIPAVVCQIMQMMEDGKLENIQTYKEFAFDLLEVHYRLT